MSSNKQENNPVKALGLIPSQAEHLLLAYLCMQKPEVSEGMYDLISKYLSLR
jgi:hypothetical protein